MKHYQKLLTAFVLFTIPAVAQDKKQGKIDYVIAVNLRESLKPDQQEFRDILPEFVDREVVYLFKGRHGMLKSSEEEKETEEGGVSVKIKMGGEDNTATYVDMDTKKNLQLLALNGKQYLYSGNIINPDDKDSPIDMKGNGEETGETKKILGYTCKKVVSKEGKYKTTYWYTTEIPILGGAIGVMSDKGLVLELESKLMSFKAKSVEFKQIADVDVLPPKGAKEIDEKEYKALKGK